MLQYVSSLFQGVLLTSKCDLWHQNPISCLRLPECPKASLVTPRSNLSAASGKEIWGALEGVGWGRGSGDTEADAGMQMELIAMWNT